MGTTFKVKNKLYSPNPKNVVRDTPIPINPPRGYFKKKECFKNFLWWLTKKECFLIRELARCTITIVKGIIY